MPASLKRLYLSVLLGGAQLALLFIGLQMGSRAGWRFICFLIAAISFAAWMSTYRRARAIDDTPTSNVASAAQGYVELYGHAEKTPGEPLLAPYSHLPCVWCRYLMERRSGRDGWSNEEQGETDAWFVLADQTGRCVVGPERAEIITNNKEIWIQGDYRYSEWRLLERDPLYVLGEFRTLSHEPSAADLSSDISALLAEWKHNQPALLQRFDRNRDGKIDLQEWENARRAAREAVEKNYRELSNAPKLDCVGAPPDGRLFLIANVSPSELGAKFRFWTWVHLVIFIGATCGFAWNLL